MRARAAREIAGFDELANILNSFAVQGAGSADGLEAVKLKYGLWLPVIMIAPSALRCTAEK